MEQHGAVLSRNRDGSPGNNGNLDPEISRTTRPSLAPNRITPAGFVRLWKWQRQSQVETLTHAVSTLWNPAKTDASTGAISNIKSPDSVQPCRYAPGSYRDKTEKPAVAKTVFHLWRGSRLENTYVEGGRECHNIMPLRAYTKKPEPKETKKIPQEIRGVSSQSHALGAAGLAAAQLFGGATAIGAGWATTGFAGATGNAGWARTG